MANYDILGDKFGQVFKYKTASESEKYSGIADVNIARMKQSQRSEAIDTIFNAIMLGRSIAKEINRSNKISEYAEQNKFIEQDRSWWNRFLGEEKTYKRGDRTYTEEDINVKRLLGLKPEDTDTLSNEKLNKLIYGDWR